MNVQDYASVLPPLLAAATLVWLGSVVLRDTSIADVFWALGFLFVAILYAHPHRPLSSRGSLVLFLVCIWSVRLSAHLIWRRWGREEDRRYATLRSRNPKHFWWLSLFRVFWLRAVTLWVISAPLFYGLDATPGAPLGVIAVAGTVIFLIGFYFETLSDWQLLVFRAKSENRHKVLEDGLWRYTRHPNYFGECLVWWGFYLIAAETVAGAWTVVGPLLITLLLLRLSGVPVLDDLLRKSKPDYRHYMERTNAFLPWFPK